MLSATAQPSAEPEPAPIDRALSALLAWCERLRAAREERAAARTLRSWETDLHAEMARYGLLDQRPLSVRPIDVRRIVGSVGGADDLDGRFLPRSYDAHVRSRFRNVLEAMRDGEELQPITVYKLRHRYYVVDGRNRVGAAKRIGRDTLEAEVTVFLPSGDLDAVALFHERQSFEAATELLLIEAARPDTYPALLDDVEQHLEAWRRAGDPRLTLPEAALRWYYRRFLPAVTVVRRSTARRLAPALCSADIVACLLTGADTGHADLPPTLSGGLAAHGALAAR